jgi:transposase
MINITFSKKSINELRCERYSYPHPRIQEKIEVLYLKAMDVSHSEICRLCNISRPTLVKYLRAYERAGINGLKEWNYKGQQSKLLNRSKSIEDHFRQNPPSSSVHAAAMIYELTGIKRSLTQIRMFMHGIGMKFRKVGFVPNGAQSSLYHLEQETYIKKKLLPPSKKQANPRGWQFS